MARNIEQQNQLQKLKENASDNISVSDMYDLKAN